MSRNLKRVPLDFDWPINKTWQGYINPFWPQASQCCWCAGTGQSPQAKHLSDMWYGKAQFRPEDRGSVPLKTTDPAVRSFARRNVERSPEYYGTGEAAIEAEALRLTAYWNTEMMHHLNQDDVDALVKDDRLRDFTHTWSKGKGWQPKDPPCHPTAKEVNEWSIGGMGHDSINCWSVVTAECKRNGWETLCKHCGGEGRTWPSEEVKKAYKAWKPTNPPRGKGYQLWQDVSEGSPVSPVFPSLETLCEWCAGNATTFASNTATAGEWLQMLKDDNVHHKEGNCVFI